MSNTQDISQYLVLGFLWGEHFPDEAEINSSTNFLFYGMTTFHKVIFKTSTVVPIHLSIFAGGGLGYSTTRVKEEQEYGYTKEKIERRCIGYLITTGGRFEIGHYYGGTSWNIRDADPHLLNTISIGSVMSSV